MDEFVKFVAEAWENESEYAGRMETWCYYCGKYQEPREPESHNEGCLHVRALAIVNAAQQMRAADIYPLCPECECELHLTTAGDHVCRNETCGLYR